MSRDSPNPTVGDLLDLIHGEVIQLDESPIIRIRCNDLWSHLSGNLLLISIGTSELHDREKIQSVNRTLAKFDKDEPTRFLAIHLADQDHVGKPLNTSEHSYASSINVGPKGSALIYDYDLRRICDHDRPKSVIAKLLASRASSWNLNPYQTNRPAEGRMLMGRTHQLQSMIDTRANLFVFGPRRIGKSSLARAISKSQSTNTVHVSEISRVPGPEDLKRVGYLDVSSVSNDTDANMFWDKALKSLLMKPKDFLRFGRAISLANTEPETRPFEVVQALTNRYRGMFTFVFDEVDRMLWSDAEQGWKIFEQIRAITENNHARFVLVGYENLYLSTHDDRFPLFGRGDRVRLGPLTSQDAKALIDEPFSNFGFTVDNRASRAIVKTTAGMPNMIQDVCKHLFDQQHHRLQHGKDLHITEEHVIFAKNAADTITSMLAGNYKNFPLAEAVAGMICVHEPEAEKGMSIREIAKACSNNGLEVDDQELDRVLRHLYIHGIIHPLDNAFTVWGWINPEASRAMATRIDQWDGWISKRLRQHHEEGMPRRYSVFK